MARLRPFYLSCKERAYVWILHRINLFCVYPCGLGVFKGWSLLWKLAYRGSDLQSHDSLWCFDSVSPDSEKWIKWQGLCPNQMLNPKDRKPQCLRVQSWVLRAGSSGIWGSSSEPQWLEAPVSEERKREYTSSWGDFFFLSSDFFFPIQALSRLDDDHTHGEGQLFLIHIAHWYKC